MYLTRLNLNPRAREVQRDLGNVHGLHQRVMSGFPDESRPDARRQWHVLHRVEVSPSGKIGLLIQSEVHPDWSRLPEAYLQTLPAEVLDMGPLIENIANGRAFRFRLKANPTKRLRTGTEAAGKRVELVHEDALLSWFARHAVQNGFEPGARMGAFLAADDGNPWAGSLQLGTCEKVYGYRGERRITFGSALFDGVLRVTDAEAVRHAVLKGIGSAKAYGFGLLSLAPM